MANQHAVCVRGVVDIFRTGVEDYVRALLVIFVAVLFADIGIFLVEVESDLSHGIKIADARARVRIFNRVALNSYPERISLLGCVTRRKSLVKFDVEKDSFIRTVCGRPALYIELV